MYKTFLLTNTLLLFIPGSVHEVASSIVTPIPVANLLCSSNKVANVITIVEEENMSIEMGGRDQGLRGVL